MNRVIYDTFGAYYLLNKELETVRGDMLLWGDQQGTTDTCDTTQPRHRICVYDVD